MGMQEDMQKAMEMQKAMQKQEKDTRPGIVRLASHLNEQKYMYGAFLGIGAGLAIDLGFAHGDTALMTGLGVAGIASIAGLLYKNKQKPDETGAMKLDTSKPVVNIAKGAFLAIGGVMAKNLVQRAGLPFEAVATEVLCGAAIYGAALVAGTVYHKVKNNIMGIRENAQKPQKADRNFVSASTPVSQPSQPVEEEKSFYQPLDITPRFK